MATAITRELGSFVARTRYGDIPREAVELIKIAFADCTGCIIAGAHEDAPRIVEQTLAAAPGEATMLFTRRTAASRDAALVNGTAAHVLDFDDFARLGGHPSAVLVPAIYADAQSTGASGERMLLAYAVAFETWSELLRRESGQHHFKGWHPTGVFGAVAAARSEEHTSELQSH